MTEADVDIEEIGVPAGEGESWTEAAERLRDGEHCPACGAEGDLEKSLAPGQRRCPTPTEQCAVVTFLEGPRDASQIVTDGGRDIREWIRERVEAHIDLEDRSAQFNPWSSKYHVRQDIQHGEFGRDAVVEEIDAMVRDGEFIYWNGWVAPKREEVLRAIIGAENASDVPRKILIDKCRRALEGLNEGSQEVEA